MKQYIIVLFALLAITACDEFTNSAEPSTKTFFPLMTVQGESNVTLECNATSYSDDGCIALEGGEEIAVETHPIGIYFNGHWEGGSGDWSEAHWVYDDTTFPHSDSYEVSYSATNVDGIPASATRNVYWPVCNGNMVTSIAGMYKMSVKRNNVTNGLPVDNNGPFFIRALGNNQYALSDGMGGWYEHGRGFGPHDGPALGMTVTANNIPTNNFTYGPTFSQTVFGGPVNITAFSVDAATKTINFTTKWDSDFDGTINYTFTVTLTQCPDGVACWE